MRRLVHYGDFEKSDWVLALTVAAVVALVDKLVVHDHGSGWPGLFMVAFWTGVAAANMALWVRVRRMTGGSGTRTTGGQHRGVGAGRGRQPR